MRIVALTLVWARFDFTRQGRRAIALFVIPNGLTAFAQLFPPLFVAIIAAGEWLFLGCAWGPVVVGQEEGPCGDKHPTAFVAKVHAMLARLTGLRQVASSLHFIIFV